jgi:hypothetical protein
VVCALALTLAYPIQRYVQQQQQIAALQEGVAAGKRKVAALEQEKARWADPNYVRQQARQRLHFVLPGETGYVVLGGEAQAGDAPADGREAVARRPWYDRLWRSVEAAADQPAQPAKQPAEHIGPGSAPKPGG